jgi:hypothetical protein
MAMMGDLQASASFKLVSGAAGEHAVIVTIAGREELG